MKINKNILLILKTYLLVLTIFSIYRVVLFITELDRLNFTDISNWTILQSFIMGVRFDIVISGYILFIPALVLLVEDTLGFHKSIIRNILFYWTFALFTVAFMISAADIPYFNQFYDRFTIGAFQWIENFDFVISMIVQEPKYFLVIIPFIIIDVIFLFY